MTAKMERASLSSRALLTKRSSKCPLRWGWMEPSQVLGAPGVEPRLDRRVQGDCSVLSGDLDERCGRGVEVERQASQPGKPPQSPVQRATSDASPRERLVSMASSAR